MKKKTTKKTTKKKAKKPVKKEEGVVINCDFEIIPIIDNFLSHDPLKIVAIEFSEKKGRGYRSIEGFYYICDGHGMEYEGDPDFVDDILNCFYPYTCIFNAEQAINENRFNRDDKMFKEIKKDLKKNIRLVKKLKKNKEK
jgi:hypothetical protein